MRFALAIVFLAASYYFATTPQVRQHGVMKNAKISELRDHLSAYLAAVRAGETVLVFDRNVPIARIEPVPISDERPGGWIQQAIERNVLRPPRRPAAVPLTLPTPKAHSTTNLVQALMEEREQNR